MKEKSQVFKTHSHHRENSSHHKMLKEKHHKVSSNKDKSESQTHRYSGKHPSADKYRSSKEGSKKNDYSEEITNDESYEELSRKKRKIERELYALDLEEAAAKKQKIEKKKSKHRNISDMDESSEDEGKHLVSQRNSHKLERKKSRHQNVILKSEPSSDDNIRLTSERNKQKDEKKKSKHQSARDEPLGEENNRFALEKNRQLHQRKSSKNQTVGEREERSSDENNRLNTDKKRHTLKKKTSNYQNVPVKDEPVSEDDRHSASERNRLKQERKTAQHPITNVKKEPLSEGDDRLPFEGNRSESSSRITRNNEFGPKANAVKDKEKPDFAVSGKLAEDTNVYNGVVIKYNEPSEARKPRRRWRLYPFKGESDLPFIPIHRQSAYLLGRTRSIADIPIDHPSCSKQHAVLQFRLVPYTREDGTKGRRVRPYIIDLESANGTFVNNNRIDPRCYVELMEKDVIKFGYSSREYVLLHEESKNDDYEDVRDSS